MKIKRGIARSFVTRYPLELGKQKGAAGKPTAPLTGTKKGKSTPHINQGHFCLVIFSTIVSLSWWLLTFEGKTYPISNRVVITPFLLPTPSSVLSVAHTPLALPLVD